MEVVQECIAEARNCGERELPAAANIAARAGVSHVTVLKALKHFSEIGEIELHAGRRCRLSGPKYDAGEEREEKPVTRSRQLAAQLYREIIENKLDNNDELPSVKNLCNKYGVCFATCRRALSELECEGIIKHDRRLRRFVPVAAGALKKTGSIIFIGRGTVDGVPIAFPPRGGAYIAALDRFSSHAGVSIITQTVLFKGTRLICDVNWKKLFSQNVILGIIIWETDIESFTSKLVADLLHFNIPIVILSEKETDNRYLAVRKRQIAYIHAVDNVQAGKNLGRFLLEQGHRRIAYISPLFDQSWSPPRLGGLRAVFEPVAGQDSVIPLISSIPLERSMSKLARLDEIFASSIEPIIKSKMALFDKICPRQVKESFIIEHLRSLRHLENWYIKAGAPLANAILSLLQDSIHQPEYTALVASDPDTAKICYDILRAYGKSIPRDISLAVFDDTMEIARRRITSYNFNPEKAVQECFAHILYRDFSDKRMNAVREITIPGLMMTRSSVGAAP